MRLTEKQKTNIITIFSEVFYNLNAELWLFGSRVDDNKLGGDIDLLIKCYQEYNELLDRKEKYEFLLQKKIGPRKIDIVLESSLDRRSWPIITNAKEQGILLTITSSNSKGKLMLKDQTLLYQKLNSYMKVINFNFEIEEEIEKAIKSFNLYPITEQSLIELSIEKRAFIDSLIYRFLVIQDYASTKLFPLIAQIITSEPQQPSWFDVLALMEKHQIITSEEHWDKLRKLRNLLSHEYENIPNLRAMDINRLIDSLPIFYKQIELMNNYVKKLLHTDDS
jgi:uncharacterized protein YutE (UPF0331/DUF86 family)